MLGQRHLILLELERCRLAVHDEYGSHRVVSELEGTCVLHNLVVDVDWGKRLACKVENVLLLEIVQ